MIFDQKQTLYNETLSF